MPARRVRCGEDSGDRGELGEAALLATDPEHLDAVDARGGRPVSSRLHSCERCAAASASASLPATAPASIA